MCLLLVATVALAFGTRILITGAPGNPAVVRALTGLEWEQLGTEQPGVARLVGVLARHEGLALLGWGFWLAWGTWQGRRSGGRWVWQGWWTAPLLTVGFALTGAGAGGALRPILLGTTGLAVLGLVLSRRSFLASGSTTA
jgi:hypothetical protein